MKLRVLTLTLLLAMLMSAFSVFGQDQTIAEIAAGDDNFSTLMAAVGAAAPAVAEALSNPDAELTVFAPANDAFAALPGFVIDYLLANPDVLTQVLQYHVVEGVVTSDQITESMMVPSLVGSELNIVVEDDGTITIDGVAVVTPDIMASNGVIHVISGVLVPPVTLDVEDPAFVEGDIVSEGSSTVTPVTEAIMNNYREAAGGDDAAVNPTHTRTGSGDGIAAFCVGDIQIANASRPIREEEVQICNDNGINPVSFRVGTDGIAVVVNPGNDWIDDASVEELAAIFGSGTTWADIREGFPEEDILRYTPGDESGTYDFFNEIVFDEDASIPAAASNLTTNSDDNVLLLGVSENLYGASYFGYAYFVNNQDQVKLLSVDGVEPSAATVEDGSYPLARPLFIITDPAIVAENPQVGEFIKYYLTNVEDVLGEVGYFPPSARGLNLAKVTIMALTAGDMMMEDEG